VPELRLAGGFKTWVAPLPGDAEELRAGWKKTQNNLWRSLRKADRSGVTARMADGEHDLQRFYALYEENVRRHRSLPYSWRLFSQTRKLLSEAGVYRLVVAERDGAIVAGAVLNSFRSNIDLVYNASSSEHLDIRPNHAVYWHAIAWGIGNGYRTFTMGQAPEGGSLARFKQQWGGEPVDRFRYDYRPRAVAEVPSTSQALRAASNRMDTGDQRESRLAQAWSRAPLPLLRGAGELAYRFF
jgi:lipid II:glycine glycyltransferase (peptidoglycan interpeptide bridge formation enzyme)